MSSSLLSLSLLSSCLFLLFFCSVFSPPLSSSSFSIYSCIFACLTLYSPALNPDFPPIAEETSLNIPHHLQQLILAIINRHNSKNNTNTNTNSSHNKKRNSDRQTQERMRYEYILFVLFQVCREMKRSEIEDWRTEGKKGVKRRRTKRREIGR